MTEEQFVHAVKDYLAGAKPDLDASRLTPDDNLWELGYLDSLSTADLVVFVEGLAGREIDLAGGDVKSVRSIRAIYDKHVSPFVQPAP